MSHRLGCDAALLWHPAVEHIDIAAVSAELAGANQQLRGLQALRGRVKDADVMALPDVAPPPEQWHTLRGERVLLCRATRGHLLRGQCVDVRLARPRGGGRSTWQAVVLARRRYTAVLCTDPTARAPPPALALAGAAVLRITPTGRSLDNETERLKRLTQPAAAPAPAAAHSDLEDYDDDDDDDVSDMLDDATRAALLGMSRGAYAYMQYERYQDELYLREGGWRNDY
jgi:hypothetical protein